MRNIKFFNFKQFTVLLALGVFLVGTCWVIPEEAESRGRGGGRGKQGGTRSSINGHRNTHHKKDVNIRHKKDVNVNKNINVDVDHRGNHIGGAIVAGMVIGSIVVAASIPPSCATVVVSNIAYRQCDGHWYQPQYSGTQVTYIVVNSPR